jgi:hypothetical protein
VVIPSASAITAVVNILTPLEGVRQRVINLTSGDITFAWTSGGNVTIAAGEWADMGARSGVAFKTAWGDASGGGGAITGAANLGTGADIFTSVSGGNIQLRSIKAGTGITSTQNTNDVTIACTVTGIGTGSAGTFLTWPSSSASWGNTATSYGSTGTNATVGLLRAANATNIVAFRDAANSADKVGMASDASNVLWVGSDASSAHACADLRLTATTNWYAMIGSQAQMLITSSSGGFYPAGTGRLVTTAALGYATATNFSFFDSTGSFPTNGSGQAATQTIFIKNSSAAPNASGTSPTGGGLLFSDAGAGKWKGTSGTLTTFGPAEPHCPNCGADFAHEWESPKYGYLTVCVPCMLDSLSAIGIDVNAFSRRTKAA